MASQIFTAIQPIKTEEECSQIKEILKALSIPFNNYDPIYFPSCRFSLNRFCTSSSFNSQLEYLTIYKNEELYHYYNEKNKKDYDIGEILTPEEFFTKYTSIPDIWND